MCQSLSGMNVPTNGLWSVCTPQSRSWFIETDECNEWLITDHRSHWIILCVFTEWNYLMISPRKNRRYEYKKIVWSQSELSANTWTSQSMPAKFFWMYSLLLILPSYNTSRIFLVVPSPSLRLWTAFSLFASFSYASGFIQLQHSHLIPILSFSVCLLRERSQWN